MELQVSYFIDWCPVNTLPIENKIYLDEGLTRRRAKKMELTNTIFDRYSNLHSYEYSLRLDGIFLIRIGFDGGGPEQERKEAIRDISNLVKSIFGHEHEFHTYPFPDKKSGLLKIVGQFCARKIQAGYKLLSLSPDVANAALDADFFIHPVEIEDPCSSKFFEKTGKEFSRLSEILEPGTDDANLAQLRAKLREGDGAITEQRACLRLRGLFAKKKDRCHLAYLRRYRGISKRVPSVVYALLSFLGFIAILNVHFRVGMITSFFLSLIAGLGVFIVLDIRQQAPRLSLIQRMIGFYSYANIYSRITEKLYSKCSQSTPSFNGDTGNFSDLIEILKVRHSIEKDSLDRRKYLWTIGFTLLAVTVALVKVAIEFERMQSG